jgi:hypothetical protein
MNYSFLTNIHTYVQLAAVLAAGLSAYLGFLTPGGEAAAIIGAVLAALNVFINQNQVTTAAAGAPKQTSVTS